MKTLETKIAMIRTEWFNNHKAELIGDWLRWSHGGRSTYFVEYHVHRNNLIVIGDIGDAVFSWSQAVTFEWIAGLNLDYFMGKCQASETGRDYYQWDGARMRKNLEDHFSEDADRLQEIIAADAFEAITDEHEWIAWCRSNAHDLLGDDSWEWCIRGGHVPHIRAIGMLEGLRMAVKQLEVRP